MSTTTDVNVYAQGASRPVYRVTPAPSDYTSVASAHEVTLWYHRPRATLASQNGETIVPWSIGSDLSFFHWATREREFTGRVTLTHCASGTSPYGIVQVYIVGGLDDVLQSLRAP